LPFLSKIARKAPKYRRAMNQTKLTNFERIMTTMAPWSISWGSISYNRILSERFIRRFAKRVHWPSISYWQELSEDFIREFADRVDWDMISLGQTLSESFMREFSDKINWYSVSDSQQLSESIIRDFADKVNWISISVHQHLSEAFICEFAHKVDWWMIMEHQTIYNPRLVCEYIDWDRISICYSSNNDSFIKYLATLIGKSRTYVKQHIKNAETRYQVIHDKFLHEHGDLVEQTNDIIHQDIQIDMMVQRLPIKSHSMMIQEMKHITT